MNLTGITVLPSQEGNAIIGVTTPVLQAIAAVGSERGYNRKLPWSEELDPDGIHVLSSAVTTEWLADPSLPHGWHSRAQGESAVPHIRCQAWIKVRGQREARQGTLDVALEFWPRDKDLIDGRRRWTVPT